MMFGVFMAGSCEDRRSTADAIWAVERSVESLDKCIPVQMSRTKLLIPLLLSIWVEAPE